VLRNGLGLSVLATMNPFVSPIKGTFVAAGYTS
jgi:hypothetical protein